jgi:hypothetical protein
VDSWDQCKVRGKSVDRDEAQRPALPNTSRGEPPMLSRFKSKVSTPLSAMV